MSAEVPLPTPTSKPSRHRLLTIDFLNLLTGPLCSNPICNKQISATYNGITVTATITDRCAGCAGAADLDFSPELFNILSNEAVGRIHGVNWNYI